jgi:hypothetical protein
MNYEWVSAKYDGEQATRVAESANAGIGYFKLADNGRGNTREVIVAFKRPIDSPTPDHLLPILDITKIEDLEKKMCLRKGIHGASKNEQKKCLVCGLK